MKLFLYEYIVSYRKEGKMQKECYEYKSLDDNAPFYNFSGHMVLDMAQSSAKELRKQGFNACIEHKKIGEISI